MLSGCNDGGWLRTSLQNCHAVQLDPCLLVYPPLRTNTTGYYVALTGEKRVRCFLLRDSDVAVASRVTSDQSDKIWESR